MTVHIVNVKSKWPTVCQTLNLCFSPVCLIPQDVKRKMMPLPTVLGILQIIVGLLNITTGVLFTRWGIHDHIMIWDAPFWLGGEAIKEAFLKRFCNWQPFPCIGFFLISGIMTILAGNYPKYFLLTLAVILNEVSAILAISAVGLYSWDLENASSDSVYDFLGELASKHRMDADPVFYSDIPIVTVRRILDIMMIVVGILQLCMNVTFVVPSVRGCVRKNSLDGSQFYNLLPGETNGNPC